MSHRKIKNQKGEEGNEEKQGTMMKHLKGGGEEEEGWTRTRTDMKTADTGKGTDNCSEGADPEQKSVKSQNLLLAKFVTGACWLQCLPAAVPTPL